MSAQRAGATADAEESVPDSEVTEQSSNEVKPGSLESKLLEGLKEEGHTWGFEDKPPMVVESEPEESEPEAEEPKDEEVSEPETEPSEGENEEEPAAAETEHKSIDEQIASFKEKGEKPPWFLSRIAEEAQKRRDRTELADKYREMAEKADAEVQRLRAEVAKVQAPAPTPQNPLADIYDEVGLQKVESSYEAMLEFATKNRDGAEGVLIGKKSDGTEVRRDFTPEEVADIRYKADRALRKDIPQRRQYLTERAKADATALEIYPEFKEPASEMTREALGLLRAKPELETILGPEVLIWIGHALRGREAYLSRNGSATHKSSATSTAADKIERASKTKIAPTSTRSRALPERGRSADLAALNKRFEETGSAEDADRLLAAQLMPRRSGNVRKLEPAEE